MATDRRTYLLPCQDPCPELVVEQGHNNKGVGDWVPHDKHRLLADYIEATWGARRKYQHRVLVDLFAGPGRIRVTGEQETRPGGSVVAWRQSRRVPAGAFTQVIVGDKDPLRLAANVARLRAEQAPVVGHVGPAAETAHAAVAAIPRGDSLCLAYLDPYNLEFLQFSIIQTLAALPRVDFAVHFSTMDLQRNVDLALDPASSRFDGVAPGWRQAIDVRSLGKRSLREAFFDYWREQVIGLGFTFSEAMPLIRTEANSPLYRLVFFSRHAFPNAMWSDVARDTNGQLF